MLLSEAPIKKGPTGPEKTLERVTGLEPADGSLGSYCLTTWRHPHGAYSNTSRQKGIPRDEKTHDNAHQEFLFTDRTPGF